jgi:broad specificity phosphatase PhoE
MTRRLYLVRHGLVENPLGCAYGRLPGFGLSRVGRAQAAAAARALRSRPIERFHVSPLQRTRETADILNDGLALPTRIEERIIEWEGHGHGETPEQVFARFRDFWEEWRSGTDREAVAVSHRDPIRALLIGLFRGGEWGEIDNLNVFPLDTGGIYVLSLDERSGAAAAAPFPASQDGTPLS